MFDMYKKAPELLYQRSYECGGKGAKRLRRLAPISLHMVTHLIPIHKNPCLIYNKNTFYIHNIDKDEWMSVVYSEILSRVFPWRHMFPFLEDPPEVIGI